MAHKGKEGHTWPAYVKSSLLHSTATTKGRQVGGLDLLGSKRASSLRRGTGPSQASSNGDKAGTWTKAPRWHRHLRRF
ncbi:hypothetical protein CRG98_017243 [Punica granatum]|uniref:Uncharacterized protein n=1 Tax=Punica granatum TaxID=22663 RepID=A0A2I0K1K7_PUNGR|nr:hypothetical protein CRG98_017243 [Punica granatum]